MREIAVAPRTSADAGLAGVRRHSLLVTFRRDGSAVATPVWAAPAAARLYVRTARASAKVRRIVSDERVLIAPCNARGRPLGAPFEATARVLAAGEEQIAEDALRAAYGAGRGVFELCVDVMRVDMCYLEIAPGAWSGDGR